MEKRELLVHEWIGRNVRVVKSACIGMEGMSGMIVDETRNTLVIEDSREKEKRIPKKTCVLEIEDAPGNWVRIEGKRVMFAPEERLKRLSR